MVSSRLTISAHYCGGDLISLEFFKNKKGCGKCGSMEKNHPCCKDVTSSIASNDFHTTTIDFDFSQSIIALPLAEFSFDFKKPVVIELNKHSIQGNAPPIAVKEPKYILFSSLLV